MRKTEEKEKEGGMKGRREGDRKNREEKKTKTHRGERSGWREGREKFRDWKDGSVVKS
jgi:ribosome assembly protein YihI (activator of Der GTPase)